MLESALWGPRCSLSLSIELKHSGYSCYISHVFLRLSEDDKGFVESIDQLGKPESSVCAHTQETQAEECQDRRKMMSKSINIMQYMCACVYVNRSFVPECMYVHMYKYMHIHINM